MRAHLTQDLILVLAMQIGELHFCVMNIAHTSRPSSSIKGKVTADIDASGGSAEMYLFGPIRPWSEFSADMIRFWLEDFRMQGIRKVHVRVNSPGGDCFEGATIYSLFHQYKEDGNYLTFEIIGLAASMASVIVLSGSEKPWISTLSTYMIHEPAVTLEDATIKQLESKVQAMKGIRENFYDLYAGISGQKKEQITTWMADETWFTAQEAFDAGFCGKITQTALLESCIDSAMVANLGWRKREAIASFIKTDTTKTTMDNNNNGGANPTNNQQPQQPGNDAGGNPQMQQQIDALQLQLAEQKAKTLVAQHATRLKLTADQITSYEKLAISNFTETEKLLKDMKEPVSISATIQPVGDGSSVMHSNEDREKWSFVDWMNNDPAGLQAMKEKELGKYKALFKSHYKHEPKL